jgi:SNF2 family DNA or RNA helicase
VTVSYPHQVEGAAWIDSRNKCLLADEMRLGKTRTTLLSTLHHLPLVILPPASAKLIWRDEIKDLCDAKIDIVQGTTHKFNKLADVTIINHEVLDHYMRARTMPVRLLGKTLVVDELHRFANEKAKRTQIAMGFVGHARRAVGLSGTPMPSRTAQLWPMLFALGIVKMDYMTFTRRYSAGWQAPWGWDARGSSELDELRKLIAPHMLRRTKKQIFGDYIPYESKLITFDRPPDAREGNFDLATLDKRDNPLKSVEGLSEVVKASGLLKVPDAIDFISDRIFESESGKVLVFAYHHEVIDALEIGLAKFHPLKLTGKNTPKQKEHAKILFKELSHHQVLIGNILSAGEAHDFSFADTSIFVETDWVPSHIDQAAQRTESMQKLGFCSTAYFLTLEKSIDHVMLRRVLEKSAVIEKVIVQTRPLSVIQPLGNKNIMSKVDFYQAMASAHTTMAAAFKQASLDEAGVSKGPATPAAEAPAKGKAGRPAKTAPAEQADPLAGLSGAPETVADEPEADALGDLLGAEPVADEPAGITVATLKKTLGAFVAAVDGVKGKGKGQDALIALFKKHGSTTITDLDESKYQACADEAQKILDVIATMKK